MAADNQALPTLFIFMALLIGAVTRGIVKSHPRFENVPYTVVLMVIGLALAGIVYQWDSGILGQFGSSTAQFGIVDPHIILYTLLPALIFESAFSVNYHIIYRESVQALVLAGPGVILSTILTSLVAKFVFPYGWSWSYSMMFGAIVSATDPVSVVSTLRELGASKRLATLIEAESLLNDGTAFVLFIIFKQMEEGPMPSGGSIVGTFFRLSFGGVFLGLVWGYAETQWLANVFNDAQAETVITFLGTYLCFWVAEGTGLAVSGVLAVVTLGLVLSRNKQVITPHVEESLHHFWEMISFIANTIVFILSGVIVGKRMIQDEDDYLQWTDGGYLFALYIFVLIIRFAVIAALYPWLRRLGYGFTVNDGIIASWGGLRGAVGLSLGLLVEADELIGTERNRSRLVFQVAGIVGLSLLINGTSMRLLLHYLQMDRGTETTQVVYEQALEHLRHEEEKLMTTLKGHENFSGADWESVRKFLPAYSKQRKGVNSEVSISSRRSPKPQTTPAMQAIQMAETDMKQCPASLDDDSNEDSNEDCDQPTQPVPGSGHLVSQNFSQFDHASLARRDSSAFNAKELLEQLLLESKSMDLTESNEAKKKFLERAKDIIECDLERLHYNERLRQEVRHRFLSAMKASYWQQFEQGQTTRQAVQLLVEASETALDNDDVSVMYEAIEPYLKRPRLLKKVDEWRRRDNCLQTSLVGTFITKVTQRWLFSHFTLGIEMASAFIGAAERIRTIVETFPELAESESKVVDAVQGEFELAHNKVLRRWEDIKKFYPEVYKGIQTRQSAEQLLHRARTNISNLYHNGLLEEAEIKRMHAQVDQQMNRLQRSLSLATDGFASGESRVRELPFFLHLPAHKMEKLLKKTSILTFDKGSDIVPHGKTVDGFHIVTRGLVEICVYEDDGSETTVETANIGRMIGLWSLLSGLPYTAAARAASPVETIFIPGKVVRRLEKMDSICAMGMWKVAGATLVKNLFREAFCYLNAFELAEMCESALYVTLNDDDPVLLMHAALLLSGECRASYTDLYKDGSSESLDSPLSPTLSASPPPEPATHSDNIVASAQNGPGVVSLKSVLGSDHGNVHFENGFIHNGAHIGPIKHESPPKSKSSQPGSQEHSMLEVPDGKHEHAENDRAGTPKLDETNDEELLTHNDLMRRSGRQLSVSTLTSDSHIRAPSRSPSVIFHEADDNEEAVYSAFRKVDPTFAGSRRRLTRSSTINEEDAATLQDAAKNAIGSNPTSVAPSEVDAKERRARKRGDSSGSITVAQSILTRHKTVHNFATVSEGDETASSSDEDEEDLITAPAMLYPPQMERQVLFRFSPGSRLLVFTKSNDLLQLQIEKHQQMGLVPQKKQDSEQKLNELVTAVGPEETVNPIAKPPASLHCSPVKESLRARARVPPPLSLGPPKKPTFRQAWGNRISPNSPGPDHPYSPRPGTPVSPFPKMKVNRIRPIKVTPSASEDDITSKKHRRQHSRRSNSSSTPGSKPQSRKEFRFQVESARKKTRLPGAVMTPKMLSHSTSSESLHNQSRVSATLKSVDGRVRPTISIMKPAGLRPSRSTPGTPVFLAPSRRRETQIHPRSASRDNVSTQSNPLPPLKLSPREKRAGEAYKVSGTRDSDSDSDSDESSQRHRRQARRAHSEDHIPALNRQHSAPR